MSKAAIRARLISDTTAAAMGVTISARDPVTALYRALIKRGYDGSLGLQVWRGSGPACFIPRIDQPDQHVRFQDRRKEA